MEGFGGLTRFGQKGVFRGFMRLNGTPRQDSESKGSRHLGDVVGAGPAFLRSTNDEGAQSFSAFFAERVGGETLNPERRCRIHLVFSIMATLPLI